MKNLLSSFLLLTLIFSCGRSNQSTNSDSFSVQIENSKNQKPRTIITTDGEVDDQDSFIRMLLYLNEFNVEGLIYSSSQWHWKGDGKGTLYTSETLSDGYMGTGPVEPKADLRWPGVTWMQEMIDKYAAIYGNLKKHDDSYPTPEYLKSTIRVGNIDFEGEMENDTEGSDYIKTILLDDKEGPVYVQIWGGTNTLARALKSIQDEYEGTPEWNEINKKISEKTSIYTVLDQDITYTKYVAPNWPDIKVIYNSAQFWSFAYMWPMVVPKKIKPYLQGSWFSENILFEHGPLMEEYYTWGDGRQIEGDPDHNHGQIEQVERRGMNQYDFISEGDSPAYFFLMDYGLRSMEDPSYGGLGGRFVLSETNPKRWEDGKNVTDINPETGEDDSSYPQVRWIEVLQNDFAARADWCINDYENANHAPSVNLENPYDITATQGEIINLSCSASDPDNNSLSYKWWQYLEAGSCKIPAEIKDVNSQNTSVVVPQDAESGQTIHLILEVCDNGTPVMTRFARVIVTVI